MTSSPPIEISVNGRVRRVVADPETPLLWILRDELGLTGTKYGCGEGICGACTVLEDDRAVRACQVPLRAAAGHRYLTIEGLSPDPERPAHPVQRVWLEERVAQCGYCQPGMILELAALTAGGRKPTVDEIESALDDHLCRCGSYPRVRRAARQVLGLGAGS